MSNLKLKINEKIATILDKMSDRLTGVARQTRQNTDDIATLREEVSDKTISLNDSFKEIATKFVQVFSQQQTVFDRIKEVGFENDKREEAQTLRDQSNVQSLKDLRDSTQKAFNQVKDDVSALLKQIQRLNERQGQVESQSAILVTTLSNRLAIAPASDSMPSDHVWVNKKLTGVYDSIQDLETHLRVIDGKIAVDNQRLEAVEAELERIKQVRKALGIIYPNASTGTTGGVNDVVVNNYPVNSEFLASESNDEFAYTDQKIGDNVVRKWYQKYRKA